MGSLNWVKRGFLFKPNRNLWWQNTHAQNPTIEFLTDNILRVYFASRDFNNKSYTGYFDLNLCNMKIINVIDEPILKPDFEYEKDGVYPATILNIGNLKFLYYLGFISLGMGKFSATINLAFSEDGKKFYKYSNNPILGIDEIDPVLVTNPYVIKNNNYYFMFYTSGIKYEEIYGELKAFYTIKLAISEDGINFKKTNKIIFPLDDNQTARTTRMSILKEGGLYRAWYTYGNIKDPGRKAYRIGYAESYDLYNWIRKDDEVGIDIGPEEYDNEMMAYPQVFKYKERYFMLYNGNNYGKDGILYAVANNS